jgi:hypothetical protein
LYGNKAMPTKTPRKTVQHLKRKNRLSGKELTTLAQRKIWNSLVVYQFGYKDEDTQIGWHLFKPCKEGSVFIGSNWVAASDSIAQLPTEPKLIEYTSSIAHTQSTQDTPLKRFLARFLGIAL